MPSKSSPDFSIRPAQPEDIERLLDLIHAIAQYANLADQVEATPERLREALFGERPSARALVAVAPFEPIVGYAIFYSSFSTFLGKAGIFLEDLFVVPEYRSRGIGKSLFLAVAEVARREGCGRLEWQTLSWNKPALDFYQTLGAEVLEDWRLHRLDGKGLAKLAAEDA